MNVFLVYKTDNWHTHTSKELIAAALTKKNAVKLCRQKAIMEDEEISPHDAYLLETISQTQGYEGEGQFVIEEVTLNNILI